MSRPLRRCVLTLFLLPLLLIAATAAWAAERVHVRVATHGDVTRLVFDWATDVDYEAALSEGFLVIDFARPGAFDIQDLRERLPKRLAEAKVSDKDHRLELRFHRPQKIIYFSLPGRVVFDLENAQHGIQTLAAMQDLDESKASSWQARTNWVPDPPRRRPSDLKAPVKGGRFTIWPQKTATATGDLLRTGDTPQTEESLKTGAALTNGRTRKAPARVEVLPLLGPSDYKSYPISLAAMDPEGFVLSLTWEQLPAAAAFRFADRIWLLFDAPLPAGTATAIERTTGYKNVTQLDSGPGSLLKIAAGPRLVPRLRRQNNSWQIDLRPRMPLPILGITVSRATEKAVTDEKDVVLRYAMAEAGTTHWVEDPDSGERLIVVPTRATGQGITLDSKLPQFAALQSQQGLVLRPFDDSLGLAVSSYSVLVSHEKGLLASPRTIERPAREGSGQAGRLFDRAAWRQTGDEDQSEIAGFAAVKQALLAAVLAAPQGHDDGPRMALARFYFAWGLFSESEAQLDILETDFGTTTEKEEIRLMRAIAALHSGELSRAGPLLSDPILSGSREAALWQAAFAAATHDWEAAAAGFAASDDLIASSSPRLANFLWRLAVEACLGIGDSGGANRYLVALRSLPQTRSEEAETAFLMARLYLLDGEPSRAYELWETLRDSSHPGVRARTERVLLEADYAAGRLDRDALLIALERLRFAWRGGGFELEVLLQLSDLYAEAGRYRQSLEMLRQAASYFPNEARAWQVAGRMRQIFQIVFLAGEKSQVPPLTALALYEEFEELTPSGAEGDRILRRLADNLVEMDLLDQAAGHLEELLRYRLTGGARAVVGARLAEIYLLNDDPEAALQSLETSEAARASPERRAERRLLRARALTGLSRHADALAVLAEDEDAAALWWRADIYGRMEDWTSAVAVYRRLLPPVPLEIEPYGPPISAGSGVAVRHATLAPDLVAVVMKAAIAASLADDPVFLARLASDYGKAMGAGPQAAAFSLLVGGLDADGGENPSKSLAIAGEAKSLLLESRVLESRENL